MRPRPMQAVTHHLIGPAHHVANVLTTARVHGRLLGHGRPRSISRTLIAVDVTLLEPVPRRALRRRMYRTWWHHLRRVLVVLAWLAGLAVIAAVGWGVWLLLVWIHAHLWLLLGLLVVALMLGGAVSASNPDTNNGHGRRCDHQ